MATSLSTRNAAGPAPSAVDELISTTTHPTSPSHTLTHEVLHNLRHAHNWTSLTTHTSPHHAYTLISGQPPTHVYTHPDEQAYNLEHDIQLADLPVPREWVLPMAQGEKWTLRKMSAVFDGLPEADGERLAKGWGGKRLLLGMAGRGGMGADGTVVYYLVGEGEIKPRQN